MGQDRHLSYHLDGDKHQLHLTSPTRIPGASGYLYNHSTFLHINCRGFANAVVMQPEPGSYSRSPVLEATTFMQPETQYFSHSPGRFFYIKDEASGDLFSLPYEPVRQKQAKFKFTVGVDCIEWHVEHLDLKCHLEVTLDGELAVEVWQLSIEDLSGKARKLSVYPAFSVGYRSWMNQSADFDSNLNAIVAKAIAPYQQLKDYEKSKAASKRCFMTSNQTPTSWCASLSGFEGEGGLHNPDAVAAETLGNISGNYESIIAAQQFQIELDAKGKHQLAILFGQVDDDNYDTQIADIRQIYFADELSIEKQVKDNRRCARVANNPLITATGNQDFDQFVSTWLPKQLDFHGQLQRLTTDPQTRNFLQDLIGASFLDKKLARQRFILALSQQKRDGALPDGILLNVSAELKYINQVPHQDINVWLPICLKAYLDEHNDYQLLEQKVGFSDSDIAVPVIEHLILAADNLQRNLDKRNLALIGQGDWCDPMNMAGHQGKGISTWLSLATSYALQVTAELIAKTHPEKAESFEQVAETINDAVNKYCWDGNWYSRGITDAGKPFGVSADEEGKIYLNPQSWAWLAGAADKDRFTDSQQAIESHLATAHGTMMLAPAYTKMREDIGRLTQKFPGSAENGSVYNHASIFHIYALYQKNQADKAFDGLMQMITGQNDVEVRGQLGNFIPNYYRGTVKNLEQYAGRSSQLVNTGTVAWYYRCVMEELFGLKGHPEGLQIEPKLPSHWGNASVIRQFRGATIRVDYHQESANKPMQLTLDGKEISGNVLKGLQPDTEYHLKVNVYLPIEKEEVEAVKAPEADATVKPTTAVSAAPESIEVKSVKSVKPDSTKVSVHLSEKQSIALNKYSPIDPELPNLFILMGVSGSGKSTLAAEFSTHYGYKFIDADSFHTPEAKKMMSEAIPLTDEIREPWIESIQSYLRSQARRKRNCVLAYSGLRKLQRQSFEELPFNVRAVFLKVDKDVLQKRLVQRKQHFFSEKLLMSQFQDFEKIKASEPIVVIDGNQSLQEMVEQINFVMHREV
ncbi:gluconokinase, GntK/IdnK-type [Thalassotalea sp. PS06]|uniref:gluconokinase, GntK/IdnK-type n=1 Tax=Thalassotalea sp. PS06 TaxID=2594005 RepID=UPI001163176C|nr:gluconokinase, GntK/IdnK-type [Thalassotalea sp. PS06]QDP01535.1 AAA family ATPase [Thalassotalea sp. PS06]